MQLYYCTSNMFETLCQSNTYTLQVHSNSPDPTSCKTSKVGRQLYRGCAARRRPIRRRGGRLCKGVLDRLCGRLQACAVCAGVCRRGDITLARGDGGARIHASRTKKSELFVVRGGRLEDIEGGPREQRRGTNVGTWRG